MKADPSQGSHFFHNITSLGISYLNVVENKDNFIDWRWLGELPATTVTPYVTHIHLDRSFIIKIDGKTSQSVLLKLNQMQNINS
jgi:hypothetical protein